MLRIALGVVCQILDQSSSSEIIAPFCSESGLKKMRRFLEKRRQVHDRVTHKRNVSLPFGSRTSIVIIYLFLHFCRHTLSHRMLNAPPGKRNAENVRLYSKNASFSISLGMTSRIRVTPRIKSNGSAVTAPRAVTDLGDVVSPEVSVISDPPPIKRPAALYRLAIYYTLYIVVFVSAAFRMCFDKKKRGRPPWPAHRSTHAPHDRQLASR